MIFLTGVLYVVSQLLMCSVAVVYSIVYRLSKLSVFTVMQPFFFVGLRVQSNIGLGNAMLFELVFYAIFCRVVMMHRCLIWFFCLI